MPKSRLRLSVMVAVTAVLAQVGAWATVVAPPDTAVAGRRLVAAYPAHLSAVEDGALLWRDGTRMPLSDAKGPKRFEDWLQRPDVADMLAVSYPAGTEPAPPAENQDPGRARNAAFFDKMYGDCRKGEVAGQLTSVPWMAGRGGKPVRVTRVNGVADKLAAVSRELESLPRSFDRYLVPAAGTYVCRVIAGTERTSAHGYGIAIDIAVKHAHYWRWAKAGNDGRPAWRNDIPMEIVRVFEKHGFIWGGRWYHYDTMHFEYRPELLPPR